MHRLDGKVVLMTGGANGLGAAGAEAMAREGAAVMVCDIADAAGQARAEAINKAGGNAAFCHHDATSEDDWKAAVAQTTETFGGLDVVVNNAGIEIVKPLVDTTPDDLRRISAINEHGVFLGIKHAVAPMSARGGGSIINLSSVAGIRGFLGLSAYCMSKGAVRNLTKAAAVELSAHRIRVNSIHPGVIQTDMGTRLFERYGELGYVGSAAEAEAAFLKQHLLGRLGKPADIANAFVYLASDESSFVTGAELAVDGGVLL